MKQIEITTRVNNTLKEVDSILVKQGFKIIRKSIIVDNYMCNHKYKSIAKSLSNCILIRYLKVGDQEFQKLTYKNKVYDKGKAISEEKINVNIDSISKAYDLLTAVNFSLLAEVKYDVIVYEKNGLELAFQNVDKIGLLLEVENEKDFEGVDSKQIIVEKKKMLKNIESLGLDISKDYDIKKAYEIVKKTYND